MVWCSVERQRNKVIGLSGALTLGFGERYRGWRGYGSWEGEQRIPNRVRREERGESGLFVAGSVHYWVLLVIQSRF